MNHQFYLKGALNFDHRGNIIQLEKQAKSVKKKSEIFSFDLEFQWMFRNEYILLKYLFKDY